MNRSLTILSALALIAASACGDADPDAGTGPAGFGAAGQAAVGGSATAGTGGPVGVGPVTGGAGPASAGAGGGGQPPPAVGGVDAGGQPRTQIDAGAQPPAADHDSGAQAPTPDVGDSGATNNPAADSPAPANVSKWANDGPFGSRTVNNSGPGGAYTLFVPEPLASNGTPNPIVVWGNGSLTTPSSYRSLLSHYASHGFFVVAPNTTNVGSGREMIAGMHWAIEENERPGSDYFGKLDAGAVGSIGYSQGGIGAVILGNEPEVTTTVPIAGGDESVTNITHPIFLIGNENDTAAPIDVISPQFTSEDTTGVFVFGILLGTGHLETLGDGGRHRGYSTAWLAHYLLGDQEAYRVFFGDDQCTLCTDREWETQRKNLP